MSEQQKQPEGQQIPDLTGELSHIVAVTQAMQELDTKPTFGPTDTDRIATAIKSDLERMALLEAGLYEPAEEEPLDRCSKNVREMAGWVAKIRDIEAKAEAEAKAEQEKKEAEAKAIADEEERKRKEAFTDLGNSVALYILMRTDMASLNPGKAVAQGSHATNLFERDVRGLRNAFPDAPNVQAYDAWMSDRGFGTAICLSVTGTQLTELVAQAKETGAIAGICTDPTYPLRDGDVTHLLKLDTCGYVFGNREYLASILGELGLMR